MAITSVLVLLLIITSCFCVDCATFENVTVTLTTRWTVLYVNNTAPLKYVKIRHDGTLVEYVNNQPMDIVKIENQNVPELTVNSVSNLPNITEVAITYSGLKKLQPGAFRNLPSLQYLNLSGNLLVEIPDGVFSNLTELDRIHLENNRISKLGDHVFGDLPKLGHIFIENNLIATWRSEWFSGSPVESVDMGHNLLEELPANAFKYYLDVKKGNRGVSLWYLILSDNKIKKINPEAFKGLQEILYLNFHNNSIEELPQGVFSTVKYINNFEFSNNRISNIDIEGVFNNTELTYVKLQNNRLSCVPVDIYNVTKIYSLNLDGNPVTCDCVQSWDNWQNQTEKEVISLDNIRNKCAKK